MDSFKAIYIFFGESGWVFISVGIGREEDDIG